MYIDLIKKNCCQMLHACDKLKKNMKVFYFLWLHVNGFFLKLIFRLYLVKKFDLLSCKGLFDWCSKKSRLERPARET